MASPEKRPNANTNGQVPTPTDALAALHALNNPPEKKEPEIREGGIGSATGFAAMLAKGNQEDQSILPSSSTMAGSATSSAVSSANADGTPRPPRRRLAEFAELPEAKLIEVTDEPPQETEENPSLLAMASLGSTAGLSATSGTTAVRPRPVSKLHKKSGPPDWYKVVIPILLGVGLMLLIIGVWSLLVLAGVKAPLVPRHHYGHAWRNTKWLAEVMLLCLPVSAAMLGLGGFMVYCMKQFPPTKK